MGRKKTNDVQHTTPSPRSRCGSCPHLEEKEHSELAYTQGQNQATDRVDSPDDNYVATTFLPGKKAFPFPWDEPIEIGH